ncbi:hypothetical protein DP20_632 [Shigella flexneri]|nr:hypothetical protein DP20_632 [Shigella flexneri]
MATMSQRLSRVLCDHYFSEPEYQTQEYPC